jgi:hypothetical protein
MFSLMLSILIVSLPWMLFQSIPLAKIQFMRILLLFALLSFSGLNAQIASFEFDTLYAFPGSTKPSESDLNGKVKVDVTADSIFVIVDVLDDAIVLDRDPAKGDRVEVWFAYTWMDFSDFIVGQKNKRNFIFRNTAESGDNADLGRFIKNADYPVGVLTSPESGNVVEQIVPAAKDLKREYIFFGLTRFSFKPDGSDVQHLDREKYQHFEEQVGLKMGNLSKNAKYVARKTETGYQLSIRMSNQCFGFVRPEVMSKIRIAVDVFDVDKVDEKEAAITSCKNRFYGRGYYFNQLELPFVMNVSVKAIPNNMIKSLGINLDLMATESGWKAFGFNSGSIVYGKDVISEQGLTEFYFFKIDLNVLESPKSAEVEWKRLDISYNDVTVFDQHEVYLIIDGKVYSGKKFRYTGLEKNDFFYQVFLLPDGSVGASFYDYEVVDPLGFGEFGHTADEFIYIQKISAGKESAIFSAGQRIEGAQALTIGEDSALQLKDIVSVNYKWLEIGKRFEVQIHRKNRKENETLRFSLSKEGQFVLDK